MSDTPRTDAQELVDRDVNGGIVNLVDADFARQLERELAEQRMRAEHLAQQLVLAIELKRDLHSRRDAYVAWVRQRNEHLERRVAKLAALRLSELGAVALDKSPPA